MDFHAKTEFSSLWDEKFDFEVSLSPASSKGDEEEDVFVDPVGNTEDCICVGLETKSSVSSGPSCCEEPSWSPLTGHKFDAISKEARQVVTQLAGSQQKRTEMEETDGKAAKSHVEAKEDFLQHAKDKLGLFMQPDNAAPSPIKRETFCVQDSPMKLLPPAFQQRLLRSSGNGRLCVASRAAKACLSTSSPVSTAKTQSKIGLRSRAGVAVNGVLPSKPAVPATSTARLSTSKTKVAPTEKQSRLIPPGKKPQLGLSRSLTSRASSRTSSCEDLLDAASGTSDVSDSSLNSSLQGRQTLATSTKSGLGNLSAVKAPSPQTRRVVERRKTSSSSSSVSSFNSSLSVSPTGKGKLNTSLNSSISGAGGRVSSRLANTSIGTPKTRHSSLYSKAPEPSATTVASRQQQRTLSAQIRKSSEMDRTKPIRSTPVKRSEPPTPLYPTPAKRVMEKTCYSSSLPSLSTAKLPTGEKAIPKPTGQFKGPPCSEAVSSPDASRIIKAKTLSSASSLESLPQRLEISAPGMLSTPSIGGNKLHSKLRCPSVLPTPVSRRLSGIPTLTPKSLTRPVNPFHGTTNLPTSTRRPLHCRPAQTSPASVEDLGSPTDIQPFRLEDDEQIAPLLPVAKEMIQSPIKVNQDAPEAHHSVQEHPDTNQEKRGPAPAGDLIELQSTEDSIPEDQHTETQEVIEVLLVDIPAPALRPEEKLLIDLSNTPDLIRTASLKPCGGQLIDLSSPLIKLSPEYKKENKNEAPLINLSF